MNDALMYFLKVNVAIALFYLFFRLAFYNDTFWRTRRFYLVFSILLSVVYPFISFAGWLEKQQPMQTVVNYMQMQEVAVTATSTPVITVTAVKSTPTLTIENILLAVYALVLVVLLVKILMQLVSILRWRLKGEKQLLQGVEIISVKENITPFSFFNMIFINPTLHNEHDTKQILIHELTHARQRHSLDVLTSELLTVVCWINPAAWLLKREIRQNLEFLADNSVLESGVDSKKYQYHLLELSYQTPDVKLGNKFNISPLKKRITMMNQEKTRKAWLLKYSLIVPLSLALILSSNAENLISSAKNAINDLKADLNIDKNEETSESASTIAIPVVEANAKDSTLTNTSNINEVVYDEVAKMPLYRDGTNQLFQELPNKIKYPKEAIKNNEQGTVQVEFVISSTGKVTNAVIKQSVSRSLDKEALRVINEMPDWIPGEDNNGQKVAVRYVWPIEFKLDKNNGHTIYFNPEKNVGNGNTKITGIALLQLNDPLILTKVKTNIPGLTTSSIIDKMPVFPGGEKALADFFHQNLMYPSVAKRTNTQGKIEICFKIDRQGNLEEIRRGVNIEIRRSKPEGDFSRVNYDNETNLASQAMILEALRVVKTMPAWIPGELKGEKTETWVTLPIVFRLDAGLKTTDNYEKTSSSILRYKELIELAGRNPSFTIDGKVMDNDFDIKHFDFSTIKGIRIIVDTAATASGNKRRLVITTNKKEI